MTDNNEELKKSSLDRELKIVNRTNYNVKPYKSNEKVLALVDFRSEANSIFWWYSA